MAAFSDLDWSRIDVHAIVNGRGIASVNEKRHQACRSWLTRNSYELETYDFASGVGAVVSELGRRLEWERRFRYRLEPDNRNLNALRDGFWFEIEETSGRVLELLSPDVAWKEDWYWLRGLLSIASEHSLRQLALGRRFFTPACNA